MEVEGLFPPGCSGIVLEKYNTTIGASGVNLEVVASAKCPCLFNDKETCTIEASVLANLREKK